MPIIFPEITVDTKRPEENLSRLAASIEKGFSGTVAEIGRRAARSVALNFSRGGRPDPFKALKASTIAARRAKAKRGGTAPEAGFETPLRVTGRLRRAASAATAGTPGSQITQTAWDWENTLEIPYAAKLNEARPFLILQNSDLQTFDELIFAELRNRTSRAEQGTL